MCLIHMYRFVIVRQLLSQDEVSLARNYIEVSQEIVDHSFGRVDIEGRTSRMSMWSYAGDDVLGLISRFMQFIQCNLHKPFMPSSVQITKSGWHHGVSHGR